MEEADFCVPHGGSNLQSETTGQTPVDWLVFGQRSEEIKNVCQGDRPSPSTQSRPHKCATLPLVSSG
jgi:hypothetical protein